MSQAAVFLWTAFLSFLPISELRGGIPFAVANGVPWYIAYIYAAALNALVAPVCWIFLSTVHKLFYGTGPAGGFRWYKFLFDRFVERARAKLHKGVEKWGWLGIAVFVAIPLPMTGAWTGTLGAWVLGISKKKTMIAVILGVICAGAVVTAVTILGIQALGFFVKKI
jgi:uncharacterized membrane protein